MPWKAGETGNPRGRPRGRRDAITNAFLKNLEADWRENGVKALIDARTKSPVEYVKLVASLLPKNVELDASDRLVDLLRALGSATDDPSLASEDTDLRTGGVAGHA